MDDQEFFDALHQLWSKTTAAQNGFWHVEKVGDSYTVMARDTSGSIVLADLILSEDDAQFIAFVHGALPEIIRRVHDAIDESDRLDTEKDDLIVRIAELEMEIDNLTDDLDDASRKIYNLEGELKILYRKDLEGR